MLLGSRWSALEGQATRWREVVRRWVGRADADVTLVDWPALSARASFSRGGALVTRGESWLEGTRLFDARLPLPRTRTPADAIGWSRIAREMRTAIGTVDVVVSAHPLWNPLLSRLGISRTTFDAVDDWRGHPFAARARRRIDSGYRAMHASAVVTANSTALAERLKRDYGVEAVAVVNGVDVEAFRDPAPAPDGVVVPDAPFAVYVGVVQERVDIDLLTAAAARSSVPVVVAGPVSAEGRAALEGVGVSVLGSLPHRTVPWLLHRAAVGLVPHRVNDFTTSMDPMKLLEYLAAGLPVVSTPLPGVGSLSPRVMVADGAAAFVAAVERAVREPRLVEGDPAVRGRDWDAVAARLWELHTGRPA